MLRKIVKTIHSRPTMDGAGVRLHRAFGYDQIPDFDPFLLLDHFGSDNPAEYLAGFPDHPHRGIETVTYMIHGTVQHRDSLGNGGEIRDGDVQWMTAGRGIIHSEMPRETTGHLQGFQLWLNLPSGKKMCPPEYRDIPCDTIPGVLTPEGAVIELISGSLMGREGPAKGSGITPLYCSINLDTKTDLQLPIPEGDTLFVYNAAGEIALSDEGESILPQGSTALMDRKGDLFLRSGTDGCRVMVGAAPPIGEPIAWRGPIVMNTEAELDTAFREYAEGIFIR